MHRFCKPEAQVSIENAPCVKAEGVLSFLVDLPAQDAAGSSAANRAHCTAFGQHGTCDPANAGAKCCISIPFAEAATSGNAHHHHYRNRAGCELSYRFHRKTSMSDVDFKTH
jgi:hypothetical protein